MQQELIDRCLRNNRRAQKEVYELLYGRMLAVVKRYTRQEEEAYEVVNNGFLKMFKNLKSYKSRGTGSFEGWVKRIMINCALDHLRSQKSYRENITFDYQPESVSVANTGLQNLNLTELYGLLDRISPMSRTVFNLYAIDGFAHKEIADKLGISIGTSKWHLYTGRQQLQALLQNNVDYQALAYG